MNQITKILKIISASMLTLLFTVSCNDQNDLVISESQALEIAKRYDIKGDSIEINLKTYIYPKNSEAFKKGKRQLIYWHISQKCNQCKIIQIDAKTGKVFLTGKYNYQN